MVINPVTSQAAMSSEGESTRRAISAETMKMPEPIIEPMTNVVALVRPRPFTNSFSSETTLAVFASVPKEPRIVWREQAQEFLCNFSWGVEKIRDDSDRVSSGLNHRAGIDAGDAADGDQRLPRRCACGSDALNPDHRIMVSPRCGGKDRPVGDVIGWAFIGLL